MVVILVGYNSDCTATALSNAYGETDNYAEYREIETYQQTYTNNYDYIGELIDYINRILIYCIYSYIYSLLIISLFAGLKRWFDHPCFLGLG